ncbi:HtaA domain-containing protein [Leifsonia poae]|uniref:HtaA domain-containing protein n=1 Tax=Leifsonia poae TaxID=110933 RepID=UPI003D6645B6
MRPSSPPSETRSSPTRGIRMLAAVLATALVSLGLTAVAATPAMAAGLAVSAPEVPAAGGTITVTGSGLAADGVGIYIGLGPAGLPGFYMGSASLIPSETVWIATGVTEVSSGSARQTPMNPDGTFSVSITVPASTGASYALYTSKAHGQGFSDPSQNTTTALSYAAPEPPAPAATTTTLAASPATAEEGTSVTLTATVSPNAAGTVVFTDGATTLGSAAVSNRTAVLSTSTLSVGAHPVIATFTPDDTVAFDGSASSATTVTITAKAVEPAHASVSVSPATGIDPAGASLTVSGSSFKQTGAAVFGVYVGIGPKSVLDDPTWFVNAGYFANVKWVSTIGADGTFSSTLTGVKAVFTSNGTQVDCTVVECGIFTMAAHGSADRTQDTFTPVSFATANTGPVSTLLTVKTSAPSATPGAGVDVTVTVSPAAAGTVTIYDGVASVAPSASARLVSAFAAPTPLASNLRLVNGSVTTHLDGFELGSRTLTASFTPDDPTAFAPAVAAPVVLTVTPDAVVDPGTSTTAPAVSPVAATTEPVCVARSVSGATLAWGVKSSFRNYISGGIANGSWTLAGVTYANGAYSWSSGKGSYNTTADKGTIRFPGSVSFTGHEGVLNLAISNIALRISSATSATIVADVHSTDMSGTPSDFKGVSFATVALSGGSSGSTLRASGAPVTLTADGAKAFAGFYNAGDALDPVSFSAPLGAEVECDSTTATGLATTGGGDVGGWPLVGGLLILVGIAAVVVRRRGTAEVASVVAR